MRLGSAASTWIPLTASGLTLLGIMETANRGFVSFDIIFVGGIKGWRLRTGRVSLEVFQES